MSRSLQVAVIGLGYWGPNLLRVLTELPGFDVVAVCDRDSQALAESLLRYPDLDAVTEVTALLENYDLDAVLIATPVSSHYSIAKEALDSGRHVFVEKPLAESVVRAVELAGLAEQRELTLMPGHTFLYSPPVIAIRQLIEAGEIGEINFISTSRVNLGLHQPDVSVMSDLGPHDFSILRYWLDEIPTTVSATARSCLIPNVADVAFVSLQYGSGTIAHAEFSWLAPMKLRRTTVVGSRKMVVYDDTSTVEPVRVYDTSASVHPPTAGEHQLIYRAGDIVSPRIDTAQPLALELADFRDAILERRQPRSSAHLGIDVIRVIEAAERSASQGGAPVDVRSAPELVRDLISALPTS